MRVARGINISRECAQVLFLVVVFFASASYSTEFTASLTSGTRSTNSDALTSSRQKRAPGWGKRAPGWGKRAPGWGKRQSPNDEPFDDLDSSNDILRSVGVYLPTPYFPDDYVYDDNIEHGLSKRAPGWGKRFSSEDSSPSISASDEDTEDVEEFEDMENKSVGFGGLNWGKRAPGWGKRAPGWGKRAPGWGKRAPGWGKRAPGWGKRAPGWGKRSYQADVNKEIAGEELLESLRSARDLTSESASFESARSLSGEALLTEKRAPGWGKRAPGWGKRGYIMELETEDGDMEKRSTGWGKRAPGWGKRAPGWGKRAPGWGKRDFEIPLVDTEVDKRAPGWGKRASTRLRRAASRISHRAKVICQELQSSQNAFSARAKELADEHALMCGDKNVANKPSKK